jgi:hypothetical protein
MFYEVRVLNAQKTLKKIISRKELSRKYWNEFEESQKGFASKKPQKGFAAKKPQKDSSLPIKNI